MALAAGGLFAAIGEFIRGPLLDPRLDPSGYAQAATSSNYGAAWILILLAAILAVFGTLAVYAYLSGSPVDGLALWGMLCSVDGGALFLIFTGSFAFAAPVIGRLFLSRDQSVMEIAVASFFSGRATAILYPSALIATLGSILLGVAIWRSATLSKYAGVLSVIHAPLLAFAPAFSNPLEVLRAACLLVSGLWLAAGMWQSKSGVNLSFVP